jgi:16S rRNA (guanine527-N7)-methyltransferase
MSTDAAPHDSLSLSEALDREHIELSSAQIALLDRYCRALWDWNTKINLTRHTTYDKFVSRDLIDSQKIADVLAKKERVLDVGSGGGVPGLVLSILRSDLQVSLSDSVGKKARALAEIVGQLGLKVPVHQGRAEELLAEQRFQSLVVRAVAPLSKLLVWFRPHWGAFDRLLVIKGPAWVEERHEARQAGLMNDLQLRKLATWPLPGTHSESVLLEVRPSPKRK